MYKTIRQGENSLQYTILPQQDEGSRAGGAGGGPAVVHRRNGRKKSILTYIGLFFVCAIITFAILIPLMVTSDLMPTPTAWFVRHANQKVRDFRNLDARQENHIIKGTPLRTPITATSTSTTTTTTTTTTMRTTITTGKPAVHSSPLWSDALSVTEFQNLYKSDESMEQTGINEDNLQQEVVPTSTMRPPPATTVNMFLSRARQRVTDTLPPSTVRPSAASRNYPKHFSLQKHEKTPAPEVVAVEQETKAIQVDTNTEDMAQVHQNWLQSHWSYVDPYLQWRVSFTNIRKAPFSCSYWN